MEIAIPIKTTLGTLHGIDCIYLGSMKQDDMDNLIFIGEINGEFISNPQYKDKKTGLLII